VKERGRGGFGSASDDRQERDTHKCSATELRMNEIQHGSTKSGCGEEERCRGTNDGQVRAQEQQVSSTNDRIETRDERDISNARMHATALRKSHG
jgi:hypothetical protein